MRPAAQQEFWDQPRVFPNAVWVWVRPSRRITDDDAKTLYRWLVRRHRRERVPIKPFDEFVTVWHAAPIEFGDPYSEVATFGIKAR